MSDSYYIKHGFKGLTRTGKLLFVLVFMTTGAAIWFFFAKPVLPEEVSLFSHLQSYLWAIIKIVGVGLVAAYFAHFFLPKLKFHKHKFYCAECGEFLGYSIHRCPRVECGSNHYTTDAELAQRRSYKWQTQNHK